jgi:hypothetical protein
MASLPAKKKAVFAEFKASGISSNHKELADHCQIQMTWMSM